MVTFRKCTYAPFLLVSDVTVLAACLRVVNFIFRYYLFLSELSASSRAHYLPCFCYVVLCLVTTAVNTLRTGEADLRFYITTVQDG
jgi:hypothetical protein